MTSQPPVRLERKYSTVQRFQHPMTQLAFTKRIESVLTRGTALHPADTQRFRKANMCDFVRLSQPKEVRMTSQEAAVTEKLIRSSAEGGMPLTKNRSTTPNSLNSSITSTNRPMSACGLRPAQLQNLQAQREQRRRVGVVWPPPTAKQKRAELETRLNPYCMSAPLRRAVFGQSLDRVLQQRSESSLSTHAVHTHATSKQSEGRAFDGDGELHVTLEAGEDDQSPHQPVASRRNKNNNIFLAAAQELLHSERQGGLEENYALLTYSVSPGGEGIAPVRSGDDESELHRLADAAYRRTLLSIGHREYTLMRKLFCELDDRHEGVVTLAQVLHFHHKYPRRLGRDILDNLRVELDGSIYLDELIRVHFPSIAPESIEQLMELYEPKVQSVDSVRPETLRQLECLYREIVERFEHATFQGWLMEEGHPLPCNGDGTPRDPMASSTASSSLLHPSSPSHLTSTRRSYPDDDKASQHSRSDYGDPSGGLTGRSASRASCTSLLSGSPSTSMPTMNAMQLLLHLQKATSGSFSVLDLLQLYRLKHLVLRPSYGVLLTRALRRAAASARFAGAGRAAAGAQPGGCVTEPATGVPIPYACLSSPVHGAGEPSVPFLTNCVVKFSDFVVAMMDYYVMSQNGVSVEPFDPSLKAYLDQQTWEKLFPFTGPVKKYFAEVK